MFFQSVYTMSTKKRPYDSRFPVVMVSVATIILKKQSENRLLITPLKSNFVTLLITCF